MKRALFIFRRDLRLEDNTGLRFALQNAEEVILCFIFTPEQIDHNPYRSNHCLQFMIESLEDLEQEIKKKKGRLYLFFGEPQKVVQMCIQNLGVDGVIVNRDYTPYSIKRDQSIQAACEKHGASFHSFDDALLHPVETTLKLDGKPYTIFTPFYRHASDLTVLAPTRNEKARYYSKTIPFAKESSLYQKILPKRTNQPKGGRNAALKILKNLRKFSQYSSERDFPYEDKTTHLSAHLKFTTLSPREVYYKIVQNLGRRSELIRSLYWRDFFSSVAFYYPWVFQGAFKKKFNRIHWKKDQKKFQLWCEGKTGFPIVDAGMRELNKTGFMHNRSRMIVASFLVKDLHIDWRWGEKYFAQNLIDYDPAVNNGNWQWVASTGCDAQPYFRIFNPASQAIKFDPDCIYIKQWIPELKEFSTEEIHTWHEGKICSKPTSYPPPIIDHAKEAKMALKSYKKYAAYGS